MNVIDELYHQWRASVSCRMPLALRRSTYVSLEIRVNFSIAAEMSNAFCRSLTDRLSV